MKVLEQTDNVNILIRMYNLIKETCHKNIMEYYLMLNRKEITNLYIDQ